MYSMHKIIFDIVGYKCNQYRGVSVIIAPRVFIISVFFTVRVLISCFNSHLNILVLLEYFKLLLRKMVNIKMFIVCWYKF